MFSLRIAAVTNAAVDFFLISGNIGLKIARESPTSLKMATAAFSHGFKATPLAQNTGGRMFITYSLYAKWNRISYRTWLIKEIINVIE